jgi:hypothetical protein
MARYTEDPLGYWTDLYRSYAELENVVTYEQFLVNPSKYVPVEVSVEEQCAGTLREVGAGLHDYDVD